jgi:hypothetical protein
MRYPSAEEFGAMLVTRPLEDVARDCVFQGSPFVFRHHPEALQTLRTHLCAELAVPEESVVIVGSAKIGFSLNPDTFPRRFSNESDIDVLIVDQGLFDKVWLTLLKWQYPRRIKGLDRPDAEWARERRKEVYWGWFVPDKIRYEGLSLPDVLKPLRDISTRWFNAFRGLGQYAALATRNVSGRLYRTWEHALLYHVDGLSQIRERLRRREGG